MKVVIFCGGYGVRMGEETRSIPKPMIEIGGRPILWHIMRYYASWGHNEFILCLGYKGEVVKRYFLSYDGAMLNDFVLDRGSHGTKVELLSRDLEEWRITFVDTGLNSTIGERLKAVASHLGEDEVFLATYGDGLTDAPLPQLIDAFRESRKTAQFLSVRPQFNAHLVSTDADGNVVAVEDMSRSEHPHQRRLLRLPPGDPGPDRAGRRTGRGDLRAPDRGARARRVSIRGILRRHGHDQGSPALGDDARIRPGTVAAPAPRRPSPCSVPLGPC